MKKVRFPELLGEMARHGETQRTLAKNIGLTYGAIWRRLTGRTDWSKSEIDKICEHYGKTYDELFKKGDE